MPKRSTPKPATRIGTRLVKVKLAFTLEYPEAMDTLPNSMFNTDGRFTVPVNEMCRQAALLLKAPDGTKLVTNPPQHAPNINIGVHRPRRRSKT